MTLSFSKFSIMLLLLVSAAYVSGCMTNPPLAPISQQVSLNVSTFSAINMNGAFQVILTGEQSHQSVMVMGPPDIVQLVKANVQNNTLMLSGGLFTRNQDTRPLLIRINMTQPLRSLTIGGATNVTAQSIGNPHLDINLQGNSNLTLKGNEVQLHSITNNGRGNIVITGIHTNIVIIRGDGQGKVDLSGQTEALNVAIGDTLTLYAQTLFANKVHIATKNNALAFICPVTALYGFAYGSSHIYYYHHNPRSLVRDTYVSGNVLKMPI